MRPIATTPTTVPTNSSMLSPNSSASTTPGTLPLTRVSQAREDSHTTPSGILNSQLGPMTTTSGFYGLLERSGFPDARTRGQHVLRNEQSATDRRSNSRPNTRPSSHTNNSDLTTRQHTTTRSTASASSSLASEPAPNPGARRKTTRNNQVQTTRNPQVRARREAAATSSSSATASTRNSGSEANQRAHARVRRDAVASTTLESTTTTTTTTQATPTPTTPTPAAVGQFVCDQNQYINGTMPVIVNTPPITGQAAVEHCEKLDKATHKSVACSTAADKHCNAWMETADITNQASCKDIKKYVEQRKGRFDPKFEDLDCNPAPPTPTPTPSLPEWAWALFVGAAAALGALGGAMSTIVTQAVSSDRKEKNKTKEADKEKAEKLKVTEEPATTEQLLSNYAKIAHNQKIAHQNQEVFDDEAQMAAVIAMSQKTNDDENAQREAFQAQQTFMLQQITPDPDTSPDPIRLSSPPPAPENNDKGLLN